MKKYFTLLTVLLMIVSASAQSPFKERTVPAPKRHLSVKRDAAETKRIMTAARQNEASAKATTVLRRTASRKVADGVVENLYQCSCTGKYFNYNSTPSSPTWTCTITFNENDGTASFSNLIGIEGGNYVTPKTVTGKMSGKKITLPTKTFDGVEGSSTIVGDYWGLDAYLAAGDYDYSSGEMLLDDEITFIASDDYSTVTTDDKAIAIVYNMSGEPKTLAFVQYPQYKLADKTPSSTISTENLDLGNVTVGGQASGQFTITSTGVVNVPYSISVSGDAFSLDGDAEGSITAMYSKTFTIVFKPTAAGEYTGTVKIKAGDKEYTVNLTGNCVDIVGDFSPIVTKGDASIFTWENDMTFPWSISKENNAVPGNVGIAPEYDEEQAEDPDYNPQYISTLKANYNASSTMRMTFDFYLSDDSSDSLKVFVDDQVKVLSYSCSEKDLYTYSLIIPKGKHTVSWVYNTCAWAEKGAKVYVGNIRLEELSSTWEDVIVGKLDGFSLSGYDMMNIDGRAYSKSSDGSFSAEVENSAATFVSFSYPEGEKKICVSFYDYTTDDYKEVYSDGSGMMGFNLAATAMGQMTISVPKGQYINNIYCGKGEYSPVKKTYQMVGTSYYNSDGAFVKDGGYKFSYPCDVTFYQDGRVTFDGLFPDNKSYWPNHAVITGKKGNDGKVRISTLKNINLGTLYGWDEETFLYPDVYLGRRYWLTSGSMENNTATFTDELVISVAADKATMTAENGLGIWATQNYSSLNSTFTFWMPGTKFIAASNTYSLIASTEKMEFGETYPDAQLQQSVTVTNSGIDNTMSVAIEGTNAAAFTTSPYAGAMESLSSIELSVVFKAKEPGEYNADLMVKNEGKTLVIPMHATVKPNIDYSSIVTEGSELITWSAGSAYPWVIEGNAAHSTNKGIHSTHSSIIASIDVPKGKVGTIAFNLSTYPEPGYDSFRFWDGDSIYMYSYVRQDNTEYQHILKAGHHDLKFDFYKDNIDELHFVGDSAAVSNIRVRLSDCTKDNAQFFVPAATFADIIPLNETYYDDAYIVNTGTTTLKLESVSGDDHFSALMPSVTQCAPGDTLHVYTSFTAAEPGEYNGEIKFKTSAGTLTLPATAQADRVIYLSDRDSYNYLYPYPSTYTAYQYSEATTQSIYNKDLCEDLKDKKIVSLTYFSYVLSDAALDCESVEYQVGTTSKDAVYDYETKGLTTVYEGRQPEFINYEMTVPFTTPYTYDGNGNFIVQFYLKARDYMNMMFPMLSSDVSLEYPGCSAIYSKGDFQTASQLPFVRVKYTDGTDGIRQISATDAHGDAVSVKVFDVNGRLLQHMQRGINIIQTTYADGTHCVTRQMMR